MKTDIEIDAAVQVVQILKGRETFYLVVTFNFLFRIGRITKWKTKSVIVNMVVCQNETQNVGVGKSSV